MILEGEIKDAKRSKWQMSQIFYFTIETFRDRVFEMILDLIPTFHTLTKNVTKSVHYRLKFST